MDKFDWQQQLTDIYSSFPQGRQKPVIGITANYGENTCKIADTYYKCIAAAGGIPIVIPPIADKDIITGTLKHIDGLVLSGGGDYNPMFCGEEPSPELHSINSERDLPELIVTRLAYDRQIPILGICRGIQTLAMALGGKVAQDIGRHMADRNSSTETKRIAVKHSQDASRSEPTHTIAIEKDTILHTIYNKERMAVNSFHHQAVADPGDKFRITATASDGTVEAMESREFKSIIGVQWHPECLENGTPLFAWLVRQAANFHEACMLHGRMLTLDSHCDTPMLFPKGIKLSCRNPQSLVDLHKMDEGRQDATIMVAYLPQPKIGETFSSKVEYQVGSPTEYADLIFDKIEEMVLENKDHVSIARTSTDLYEDKRHRRKSIMLGIENGLAINGSLANLKHFAQRGIVYMTLCHNGDNDICDSAKGCNTHNGVSRFGEQVILEMNRLGIMVDLSHGSEKSFYDTLEISRMPIVCSHSSSYSLCNHPRNLTDDQMRALAAKGGVAQTTLYHGFLNTASEATVLDAIAHLEHAIRIMGIDHVGIGTDFDGDGGVRGFSCSSEAINFTRLLLSRRYSERDIQKIWGGNFLRVMTTVQSVREK